MKLSRRGLLSTLPALTVVAQQPEAPATERPSRAQDLASARLVIQNNAAALAKVKVPIAVEPAAQFKA